MDRILAARRPWRGPRGCVPRAARSLLGAVVRHRHLRRRLLATLAAAGAVTAGWLALRDSPLVSVDHVQISGLSGPEAQDIRAALGETARHQSTLHVRMSALRAAVGLFPVVRDLRVSTSFPHDMHITVIEQLPVAALLAGSQRVAVAADGAVLGPNLVTSQTPVLGVPSLPRGQVDDPHVLGILAVLGAAPGPLAQRVARVFSGPNGLTVDMRSGPSLYFGDASRPHAKWMAAARVLVDPGASGALYIDVRLPDRPAAGGIAGANAAQAGQVSAIDPTASALAANLALQVTGTAAGAGTTASTSAAGGAQPGPALGPSTGGYPPPSTSTSTGG